MGSVELLLLERAKGMRQAGHVACVVKRRGVCWVLLGNLRERHHLRDPGIDERIIS